jgi:predicted Zn-dependent peptidase
MEDSAEETGGFLASGLLFHRPETPEEHVAEMLAVDSEQVRAVAQELARPERLNVIAVGLLEDGEDARLEDAVKGWVGAA